MYVCVCKAITENHVRTAADAGARSMKDIANALGAATQCGKCGYCVREVLLSYLHARSNELRGEAVATGLALAS